MFATVNWIYKMFYDFLVIIYSFDYVGKYMVVFILWIPEERCIWNLVITIVNKLPSYFIYCFFCPNDKDDTEMLLCFVDLKTSTTPTKSCFSDNKSIGNMNWKERWMKERHSLLHESIKWFFLRNGNDFRDIHKSPQALRRRRSSVPVPSNC